MPGAASAGTRELLQKVISVQLLGEILSQAVELLREVKILLLRNIMRRAEQK